MKLILFKKDVLYLLVASMLQTRERIPEPTAYDYKEYFERKAPGGIVYCTRDQLDRLADYGLLIKGGPRWESNFTTYFLTQKGWNVVKGRDKDVALFIGNMWIRRLLGFITFLIVIVPLYLFLRSMGALDTFTGLLALGCSAIIAHFPMWMYEGHNSLSMYQRPIRTLTIVKDL